MLEKTGLRHAAVCKRWSLICAPRGAFAQLVETAGDTSSELVETAGDVPPGSRMEIVTY